MAEKMEWWGKQPQPTPNKSSVALEFQTWLKDVYRKYIPECEFKFLIHRRDADDYIIVLSSRSRCLFQWEGAGSTHQSWLLNLQAHYFLMTVSIFW